MIPESPIATVVWRRLDNPGHDAAELRSAASGWRLEGVAILAHDGRPCRLSYAIRCAPDWMTQEVAVSGFIGTVPVAKRITRERNGVWLLDGAVVSHAAGCADVDLAFTPATNTLPIRRLNLAVGASAAVRSAWLRFPELTLEVLDQSYTRLGPTTYRYESTGGAFRRDLTVNEIGFVTEYPGLWIAEAVAEAVADGR